MKYIYLLICLHLSVFASAQFKRINLEGGRMTGLILNRDKMITASYGSGIFTSDTANIDWQASNTGLQSRNINSLSVYKDTLYVAADTIVYRSTDNGKTWTELFRNSGLTYLFQFLKTTTAMYVLNPDTIKCSTDNGATWSISLKTSGSLIRLPVCNTEDTLFLAINKSLLFKPSPTAVTGLISAANYSVLHNTKVNNHHILFRDNAILHYNLGKTDTTIITTSNPGYTPYQLFSTNGKVYAILQQINNNKIRILQSADTGATWSYHSTISSCKNTKGMVLVNNKLYAANDYRGVYTTNVTDTVWTKANKNLNGYPVMSLAVSDNAMAVATTGEEIMYLAPDFKQWKIAYPSAFFYNHKKIYLIHDSLYNVTTSFIRRWDNTRNEWETIAGDGYITASCLYKVLEFYFLPVCKSNGYGRTLDVTTGEYDERFEKKPEGKYVTDMTEGDWELYGTLNGGGIILLGPSSLSALTIVNTPPIKKIVFAGGYLFGIPALDTGTFMRVPTTFDSTTQVDYLTSNLPEQGWVDVYIDDNETIFLLNKNGKIYYSVNQGTDWTIANTSGLPADEYTSLNKRNDTLFIGTKSNYILYNTVSSVLSDKKIKPKQFNVNIFPNPFSNEFRVTCDKPFDSLSVLDMYGKEVYSTTVPSTELSINLSASPKGIYFVKIISDNNMVKTIKLIRE